MLSLTICLIVILVSIFSHAQSQCTSVLQNETTLDRLPNLKNSRKSLQFWTNFDTQIMAAFSKNLLDEKIYDRRIQHVRTLESVFKLRIAVPKQNQSVAGIVKIYNDHMDNEIRAGRIKSSEVIRPIFVFELPSGEIISRQIGEEIPEGAVPFQKELPSEHFDKLFRAGFFPLGDSSPAFGGARRTTFEHDLAHFTAFVEQPEYMGMLLRLYKNQDNQTGFMEKYSAPPPSFSSSVFYSRLYLYFESMTVVNQSTKEVMLKSLLLSDAMRERLDHISLREMETYLATIPTSKLVEHFTQLLSISDQYFTPIGGAARNPGDRDLYINNKFHGNLFYGLGLHRKPFLPHQRVIDLKHIAEFQIYAIRLRDVTISNWVDQAFVETVPTDSNLYNLLRNGEFPIVDGFWKE